MHRAAEFRAEFTESERGARLIPTTPTQWLPVLAARLDASYPRVNMLRRYVSNDAPLPEMGKNVKASWQRFQKQSRTNWAGLICTSVAERIVPNGVEVGDGANDDAVKAARKLYRDSRLDLVLNDAVWSMLVYRTGYLTVWAGDGDQAPIITADSPEMMYVATEPLRPWKARAGLRWWRDSDAELDYGLVWCQIGWQLFRRPVWVNPLDAAEKRVRSTLAASGHWEPTSEFVVTGRPPPVVVMDNPTGVGEFEMHTDIIDRINAGVLERRVTAALQAFRQRAMKGGLPEKDAEGNDIDWAAVFEPAPGALWDIPSGIDIWESEQTDIRPMLDAVKDDLRQLSAVTHTSLTTLIPDSANQSATGAAAVKEGEILKAKDRLKVVDVAASAAVSIALQMQGIESDDTIRITWEPPDHVSLSEKYTAAAQAKAAGESFKSIARRILGYSPEEIAQDEMDRAQEQLALMSLVATPQSGPAPAVPQV